MARNPPVKTCKCMHINAKHPAARDERRQIACDVLFSLNSAGITRLFTANTGYAASYLRLRNVVQAWMQHSRVLTQANP